MVERTRTRQDETLSRNQASGRATILDVEQAARSQHQLGVEAVAVGDGIQRHRLRIRAADLHLAVVKALGIVVVHRRQHVAVDRQGAADERGKHHRALGLGQQRAAAAVQEHLVRAEGDRAGGGVGTDHGCVRTLRDAVVRTGGSTSYDRIARTQPLDNRRARCTPIKVHARRATRVASGRTVNRQETAGC